MIPEASIVPPVSPVDVLASYVPAFIARQCAARRAPPASPFSEASDAVVLFADISGFTALAERLAARGPAGAEVLTSSLNDYFGTLIEIVAAHQGEVVKFAGDAALGVWRVANGDRVTGARLAVACALAAQEKLHGRFSSPMSGACRGAGSCSCPEMGWRG